MTTQTHYPRFVHERLEEALADSPVVLLHGPRQSGKTTLVREVGTLHGYQYLSFDDDVVRSAAKSDPVGFVDDLPGRTILDEVQRVPELFTSIKRRVDDDRSAGGLLLTGSANVLLVPTLADSLAGRMAIERLHPLSQSEMRGSRSGFLDTLLSGEFPRLASPRLGAELAERVCAGGYPPALHRSTPARRQAWYADYVTSIVQRDIQDLRRVRALGDLPRLVTALASQSARLFNISELASPFQASRTTIAEYVTLLERVFLAEQVPPWHTNRLSRLVKTPKLHLGDTGIACALLGVGPHDLQADRQLLGQLLETFVYQELRRMSTWNTRPVRFHHFRDRDGLEVDLVLEQGMVAVAGVEVKASATVRESDFRGLRKLAAAAGTRFASGVVLYDGERVLPFGEHLYAVPIRLLWETPLSG